MQPRALILAFLCASGAVAGPRDFSFQVPTAMFGAVSAVDVEKADDVPTLYIAGDSTSTDQPGEPYNSWGQILPRFFKPEIAVANHGESGESLRSFIGERRLAKVMSVIRPGDYLFIQMGHNDQKERGEGVSAFTTYKADQILADTPPFDPAHPDPFDQFDVPADPPANAVRPYGR